MHVVVPKPPRTFGRYAVVSKPLLATSSMDNTLCHREWMRAQTANKRACRQIHSSVRHTAVVLLASLLFYRTLSDKDSSVRIRKTFCRSRALEGSFSSLRKRPQV